MRPCFFNSLIVFIKLVSDLHQVIITAFVKRKNNFLHEKNLTFLTLLRNVKALILQGFSDCLVLLNP